MMMIIIIIIKRLRKYGKLWPKGCKDLYVTEDFVASILDICRLPIMEVLYKVLQCLVERSGCNECTRSSLCDDDLA